MLAFAAALPQINPPGGGGPSPGLPSLENVGIDQKDYQGNVQTTQSSIFPSPHPAIEYNQAPGSNVQVSHIAYVKGGSASVKLRVYNRRTNPISGSLAFTDARLQVPGPNYTDPGPHYLPVSLSVTGGSFSLQPNGTAELTATISGLPSHVAVGALQVQYNMPLTENPGTPQAVQADNGTQGNWQTWERICVLDAAPIGLQTVPWTDFLEYTCRWAYGASGTTEVLREMTKGVHYGSRSPWNRIQYSPSWGYYWSINKYGVEADGYLLGNFLNDLSSPIGTGPGSAIWIQADCRDFAGLLYLALISQGVSAQCEIVKSYEIPGQNQVTTAYAYWPLCKAGNDPTITLPISDGGLRAGNYRSGAFNFHMIVEASNLRYDASSSYYYSQSGALYLQPAFEWDAATYWQNYSLLPFGHAFSRSSYFNFLSFPFGYGSELVPLAPVHNITPSEIFG